jgi:tetratricopeptide (TPR) repeat protein
MDSGAVLARFEAERQALALMDHPNIARVLDGGTTAEGRPYFVMELVKGLPLTEYCDDRRLSVRARLDLFVQVCSAVQHAHQKGVIHRDLKPSNILVTEHDGKPVPKVIDFGLAKALHSLHALTERTLYTSFGTMVGTPLYMAPEQVGINALDVDTRTDIYALGVLLYELLTGTTPLEKKRFKEAAWEEMRRLIREEEAPRPSVRLSSSDALPSLAARRQIEPAKLSRLIRGDLDWIVLKALEKDRNRRYETANGLAMDVQRHLADEPVLACPPSAGYRMRKFARKHRAGLTAVAAFAALLFLGAAVSSWLAVQARLARDAEVAERMEAEQQRDRALKAESEATLQRDRALKAEADAKAAGQQAAEEKAIAQAVNAFLRNDLLRQTAESAQVQQGFKPDPDVKMRTLLDRASSKVEERFKDKPRVEAAVRQAIAWPYHQLGGVAQGQLRQDLNRAAQVHQARAIEVLEKALGKDNDQTLIAVYGLGAMHVNLGQNAQAEPYFRRVYEGGQRAHGADDPRTLEAANNLAYLYQRTGRQDQAEKVYQEALESARRVPGAESIRVSLMGNLGFLYSQQNRFAEAEPLLRQSLEDRRRISGDKSTDTRKALDTLGLMYIAQGRGAEAEPLLREALAVVQTQWDDQAIATASPLSYLSHALVQQGKYAEAESLLRKSLSIFEAKAPDRYVAFYVRSLLGEALAGQHKYADAEAMLRQGYEGLKQREETLYADFKFRLPEAVERLVRFYEARGKPDEAAKWRAERAKYPAAPAPPTK